MSFAVHGERRLASYYWLAASALLLALPLVASQGDTGAMGAADIETGGAAGALGVLSQAKAAADEAESTSGFWAAFFNSVSMIIVTELGDKTFFIAAVLAMRHDRLLIFAGAMGALIAMTILSAAIGNVLPNLLPRRYTHYASALLFLYFGIKLLNESRHMEGSGPSDELQEVEEELIHKKEGAIDDNLENGGKPLTPTSAAREQKLAERPGMGWKVFTQAFTLTFLAEWGDRSQIATIALAAAKDPVGVTAGGVIGHSMCTGLAVVGGRILAARISEKTVAVMGGALFLLFGCHSLLVGP